MSSGGVVGDGDVDSAVGIVGVRRMREALEDIAFPLMRIDGAGPPQPVEQDVKTLALNALVDVYGTEAADA